MNRQLVAALVAYVTQLAPAQQFDEYTALAWHDVLGDLDATFEQGREAIARVARTERWIYPGAIRAELQTILRAAKPEPSAPAIGQIRAWAECEDRPERIARGMAKVREAIAAANKPYSTEKEPEELSEKEQKLRAALLEQRASQRRRSDPSRLGSTGNAALRQISQARKARS